MGLDGQGSFPRCMRLTEGGFVTWSHRFTTVRRSRLNIVMNPQREEWVHSQKGTEERNIQWYHEKLLEKKVFQIVELLAVEGVRHDEHPSEVLIV